MTAEGSTSPYSRSLIEASLDPLVTISVDGQIMDVNIATETVTGVQYNATGYTDENGDVAGVFIAARDVTDLNRSRLELEQNRQIAVISQMVSLLQVCQETHQAFPIARSTLSRLFPSTSGACFTRSTRRT